MVCLEQGDWVRPEEFPSRTACPCCVTASRWRRRLLEAAGAVEIREAPAPAHLAHPLGTARMGRDPKSSVVNAWNQAHAVEILFIVDGSSFTTSGGVNPTSTIGALALRAADGIWRRRSGWV